MGEKNFWPGVKRGLAFQGLAAVIPLMGTTALWSDTPVVKKLKVLINRQGIGGDARQLPQHEQRRKHQ